MKIVIAVLLLISCYAQALPEKIFLLRHAEKATGPNPSLTQQGHQRAKWVANTLIKANPVQLFSTDYLRTKQTIKPLAVSAKLPIQSYNPRKLSDFVDYVKTLSGTVVILGHSNTTPKLASLLTGEKFNKFDESEFNLYFELDRSGLGYQAKLREMNGFSHRD